MKTEVRVFLKCLSCRTFITSPSISTIRKHFEKCQLEPAEHSSARHDKDKGDLLDMDCEDFIDDQMETVTFTQPSLLLKRCPLEHSNIKKFESEQGRQSQDNESNKDDEDTKYICAYPDCASKRPSAARLKSHFIRHLKKNPYVCNVAACKTKSSSPSGVRNHLKQKHQEVPPTCTKCGVTYKQKCQLKVHKCEANIDKVKSGDYKLVEIGGYWKLKPAEENYDDIKVPLDPRFISTPRLVSNDPNDKTEQYIQSLKRIDINAIIKSDPVFIQACKKSPGFGELLLGKECFNGKFRPFQKRPSKFFQCSKCPTMFTGRPGYVKHKTFCKGVVSENRESSELLNSTHVPPAGAKQLQIGCPACGKPFQNSEILEKHLNNDHGPDEVFKCEQPDCGKFFLTAKSKDRHLFVFHKDRPYQCAKCERCYAAKSNFDRHMQKHLANPNFGANKTPPCDQCGKTFKSVDSLRTHLKTMHGIVLATVTQLQSLKKNLPTKNKRIISGPDSELLELPKNSKPVVVQIKIEPELTIVPDVIKSERLDFN